MMVGSEVKGKAASQPYGSLALLPYGVYAVASLDTAVYKLFTNFTRWRRKVPGVLH